MTAANRTVPFHFVDVFAPEPLTGNPLAVVDGGADLSLDILRRIAREFNQSETTFVLPPTRPGADWRLRSLTSVGAEVFGAGHNALGAWWWLASAGRLAASDGTHLYHQEIGEQVLPVSVTMQGGSPVNIIMEQEAPRFDRQLTDGAGLAKALGLSAGDLAFDRIPCQVVYTGAPHLMVPLKNREAVDRVRPDANALHGVLEAVGGEGCYVFSMDARHPGTVAYTRFFNPTVGIVEDPATGTAAGPLGAHLLAHGLARSGRPILIEQGTAMGRTSLLEVEVHPGTVKLAGRCVVVASGNLFI